MSLTTPLDELIQSLDPLEQQDLEQGEVVLLGQEGSYAALSLVKAPLDIVWNVLTAYEQFPEFLPSVVSSRVLEKRENRLLVERKDRRKIGLMPIKVKIVTENIETYQERIDYRMVEGTMEELYGDWRVTPVDAHEGQARTLLVQNIKVKGRMGPLLPYFYEVFEKGLTETLADLSKEMERRHAA
jgi:ribosome-associated toxin RatA of RatAB toxin-antitoxin module